MEIEQTRAIGIKKCITCAACSHLNEPGAQPPVSSATLGSETAALITYSTRMCIIIDVTAASCIVCVISTTSRGHAGFNSLNHPKASQLQFKWNKRGCAHNYFAERCSARQHFWLIRRRRQDVCWDVHRCDEKRTFSSQRRALCWFWKCAHHEMRKMINFKLHKRVFLCL